jgi:hypothetical protein
MCQDRYPAPAADFVYSGLTGSTAWWHLGHANGQDILGLFPDLNRTGHQHQLAWRRNAGQVRDRVVIRNGEEAVVVISIPLT